MEFYAYLWLREDGTPYYAGKGCENRAWVRNSHHCFPPKDLSHILIFRRASEAEAWQTEKELIRNWGRKDLGTGCLRNFTDGGEGQSGLRHTSVARKKMSQSRAGHPSYVTPAGIAKMQATKKLRRSGLGNKYAKGTTRSNEWKAAFSLRMEEVWANDENRREKTKAQMTGNNHALGSKRTAEEKAARSAAMKLRYAEKKRVAISSP